MKVLLTADLHGALRGGLLARLAQARGGGLVAVAGDLLDCFAPDLAAQAQAASKWLRTLTAQVGPVAVCSGNHDPDNPNGAGWLLQAAEGLPAGGRLVTDGHHAVLAELVVSVVAYWNRYEGGQEHHEQLRAQAEATWRAGRQLADTHRLPWMVLHHEPPEDTAVAYEGRKGSVALSAGSTWCAWWLRDYRPDYVLSGHVHQAPFVRGGAWAAHVPESGTWCFNPGRRGAGPGLIAVDTATRQARWWRTWQTQADQVLALNTEGGTNAAGARQLAR